ncbi:lamin tail domain-containing protein [Paludisphaera soli]|uniref:lamin tail domain-containing protein n=1 Tax=Paludisphaera soli TaxID=2712865 RepID=UPI0013EB1168|nr:lamin tail domain-containing protein [Paludisphaera soli]
MIDPTLLERVVSDIDVTVGPLADADDSSPPVGPSPIPSAGTTDAVGEVQITALLPNPIGADEGKETVKLANPTEAEVDLADREFPLTGKLPPGERVTFKLADTLMVLGNNGG